MSREVNLSGYLPPFLQEYPELVATLSTEDPEFNLIWEAADKLIRNEFIATADKDGIERFEKLLGISPDEYDTLDLRRTRVMTRWFTQLPYSMRVLLIKLNELCGEGGYTLTENFETGYSLEIDTHLDDWGKVEELARLTDMMVPANIVISLSNTILAVSASGAEYFTGYGWAAGIAHATVDLNEKDRSISPLRLGSGAISFETAKTAS